MYNVQPAQLGLYIKVDLPVVSIYYIRDIVGSTIIMYSYHELEPYIYVLVQYTGLYNVQLP